MDDLKRFKKGGFIRYVKRNSNLLDETFGIGVGAPLGLDQGIPNGGDGIAVVPQRFGEFRKLKRRRRKLKNKKKSKTKNEAFDITFEDFQESVSDALFDSTHYSQRELKNTIKKYIKLIKDEFSRTKNASSVVSKILVLKNAR